MTDKECVKTKKTVNPEKQENINKLMARKFLIRKSINLQNSNKNSNFDLEKILKINHCTKGHPLPTPSIIFKDK